MYTMTIKNRLLVKGYPDKLVSNAMERVSKLKQSKQSKK